MGLKFYMGHLCNSIDKMVGRDMGNDNSYSRRGDGR